MKPNKDIPKMEPFFSTEDRMKIIFSIILLFKTNGHGPIQFMDLYTLSNGELHTLHKVLTDLLPTPTHYGDIVDEDFNIWGDDDGVGNDTPHTENEPMPF